jgi:hypothetical protein
LFLNSFAFTQAFTANLGEPEEQAESDPYFQNWFSHAQLLVAALGFYGV